MTITQDRLKELLSYDPDTGHFRWRRAWGRRRMNAPAGCVDVERGGYIVIGIDRVVHQAHRLAWLYMFGRLPLFIDHINCDRGDNRLCNLRECERSQNQANRGKQANNTSGFKGVTRHQGKWMGRVNLRGKAYRFSGFDKPEEAAAAYDAAALKIHGEFARTNGG